MLFSNTTYSLKLPIKFQALYKISQNNAIINKNLKTIEKGPGKHTVAGNNSGPKTFVAKKKEFPDGQCKVNLLEPWITGLGEGSDPFQVVVPLDEAHIRSKQEIKSSVKCIFYTLFCSIIVKYLWQIIMVKMMVYNLLI